MTDRVSSDTGSTESTQVCNQLATKCKLLLYCHNHRVWYVEKGC